MIFCTKERNLKINDYRLILLDSLRLDISYILLIKKIIIICIHIIYIISKHLKTNLLNVFEEINVFYSIMNLHLLFL